MFFKIYEKRPTFIVSHYHINISIGKAGRIMISGFEFSNTTIASEEKKYSEQFYKSDSNLLSDSINYYGILFLSYLRAHGDNKFRKLDKDEQSSILDKVYGRFQNAMKYAFNKGHQTGFSLLLLKSSQEYKQDFFENPDAHDFFLFTLDEMVSDDVFKKNVNRDVIDRLIQYIRNHNIENGYAAVMQCANRFYRKGVGVAFEQVRQNIVHKNYKVTGRSRMLNVPYNRDFTATPAFKASFSLESPAYEEWDLHWDETYGFEASKSLIAKAMIHQFSAKEIKEYADINAKTYKMMHNFFKGTFKDDELLYMIRIDFLAYDSKNFPRKIQNSEITAIRLALSQSISRRLQVDGDHIFISD